jgi:hypothetical protein
VKKYKLVHDLICSRYWVQSNCVYHSWSVVTMKKCFILTVYIFKCGVFKSCEGSVNLNVEDVCARSCFGNLLCHHFYESDDFRDLGGVL